MAGGPDPLKNHKNIGFLSNTGPDPLKITKLHSQYSMLGHHRPANETPFKWRFAGGPVMVLSKWYLDSLVNLKNNVKAEPPQTKLSGSEHVL